MTSEAAERWRPALSGPQTGRPPAAACFPAASHSAVGHVHRRTGPPPKRTIALGGDGPRSWTFGIEENHGCSETEPLTGAVPDLSHGGRRGQDRDSQVEENRGPGHRREDDKGEGRARRPPRAAPGGGAHGVRGEERVRVCPHAAVRASISLRARDTARLPLHTRSGSGAPTAHATNSVLSAEASPGGVTVGRLGSGRPSSLTRRPGRHTKGARITPGPPSRASIPGLGRAGGICTYAVCEQGWSFFFF